MIIFNFHVDNKVDKPRYFQERFLVTNTKFELVLKMLYLKFSNADKSLDNKMLI